MPDQSGAFIWYELTTPDPAASKAFYDAVVGWDIDAQSTMPGDLEYRMIKRSDGGTAGGVMTLTDEMKAHGSRPMWLGYVMVADVDATLTAMQSDGATLLMPASDIAGVGRFALIADPQGAPLYIMKPKPPEGAGEGDSDVFSVDRPQHVRWNELSTTDPAAAIAFYTRHFGWRQDGDMDMGEMGKYQFLYRGETMIGAVMPKMPQVPASVWSFYIGVDDIDRGHEAVKSAGGHIVQEPIEIPGGEFSLFAIDPQGAAFGLVGPRRN